MNAIAELRSLSRGQIAVLALLLSVLVFGGGSPAGPLEHALAQLAGIALLALALPGTDWRQLYHGDRAAAWLALCLLALIAAQLVPLPPSVWAGLPGRSLYAQGDTLMFGRALARPLSLDPGETLAGLVALAPAFATWLLTRRDPDFAGRFAVIYLAFLLASLGLALAQLSAGPGMLRFYPTSHDGLPTGFFANRNHQSIAMVCGIPLAAALHRARRPGGGLLSGRLALSALIIACAIGALLTGSRTGAALLLPALAAGVAIAMRNGTANSAARIGRMPVGAIAGLALLLLAVLALGAGSLRPGGALGLVFSRSFFAQDPRYAFWPVVVGMLHNSLPWGIGLGSFRYAFEVASTPDVLRPLYVNHAHNDWMEFVLETGLPGLALSLAFVVWVVLRCRRAINATDGSQRASLGPAAGAVILLLLVHSTFDYPLRTIALSTCVGFCAGTLSPPLSLPPDRKRQQGAWPMRIATVLLAMVMTGFTLIGAARNIAVRSERTELASILPAPGPRLLAERALDLAQRGAPFGAVADAATRAVALSPLTEPAFTAAALTSPDPAQAAALLNHALRLSRRDKVLLIAQLSMARSNRDPARAFAAVDALYRLQMGTPAIARDLGRDLEQPSFMAEAIRLLASGPGWRGQFLAHVAATANNRPALARLVESVQHSANPLTRGELAAAIGETSFGPAPDPAAAAGLWRQLAPGMDPMAWPSSPSPQPALPFDWNLGDNTRLMPTAGGMQLAFDGEATTDVPLATRRMPWPAGHYRVSITASQPGTSLVVGCGGDRRQFMDGDMLDWNNTCPMAEFAVYGSGSDGWVGKIRLVPLDH